MEKFSKVNQQQQILKKSLHLLDETNEKWAIVKYAYVCLYAMWILNFFLFALIEKSFRLNAEQSIVYGKETPINFGTRSTNKKKIQIEKKNKIKRTNMYWIVHTIYSKVCSEYRIVMATHQLIYGIV